MKLSPAAGCPDQVVHGLINEYRRAGLAGTENTSSEQLLPALWHRPQVSAPEPAVCLPVPALCPWVLW